LLEAYIGQTLVSVLLQAWNNVIPIPKKEKSETMTVEVLTPQQIANQEQITRQIESKRSHQSTDRRNTTIALFTVLILMQGVDTFFASETTRNSIFYWSKKANTGVEMVLETLIAAGAQCEANHESNSALCPLYARLLRINEFAVAKENEQTQKSDGKKKSSSELMHVVVASNITAVMTESYENGSEGHEFTTTLIKTHETGQNGDNIVRHPLLRFILHSPFFLQLILPSIISVFALYTVKFIPGHTNGTVSIGYFMLTSFFFARLFLQLY
jgi:hypothetical protein